MWLKQFFTEYVFYNYFDKNLSLRHYLHLIFALTYLFKMVYGKPDLSLGIKDAS